MCQEKEAPAKKKMPVILKVLLAAVILAGLAFGGYEYWLYRQPKFHDFTVELGTQTVGLADFMTEYAKGSKVRFVSDPEEADLNHTGEYELVLGHGRSEETVTLSVIDTTAPEVVFIEKIVRPITYVPEASDFVESVTDFSETTVGFAKEPGTPDSYEDWELEVVVTDASGNDTRHSCTLSFAWLKEEYVLEYGTELEPADLLLDGKNGVELISAEELEKINTAGVGEYELISSSGTKSMVCRITVTDTTGPVLEVQEVKIYVGKKVKPEDFIISATDISGEVTVLGFAEDPDTSSAAELTPEILAEDIYGNISSTQVVLNVVKDKDPPVISGLSNMSVSKNSSPDYMSGVSAKDANDGRVEVHCNTSNVDLTKAGTYYITYTATDAAGNKASSKRQITVAHDSSDTAALVSKVAADLSDDPESLRNYVRNKISYSSSYGGSDPVWYGLKNHTGNCYVHAKTLQALLSEKGISNKLIWTTDKSHYWNLVKTGDGWRHIDSTPGSRHTKYSLMTDAQRLETLQGRSWDTENWPACE